MQLSGYAFRPLDPERNEIYENQHRHQSLYSQGDDPTLCGHQFFFDFYFFNDEYPRDHQLHRQLQTQSDSLSDVYVLLS